MAQEQRRLPIIIGPEEEAVIAEIQGHLGQNTSMGAAVRYAILEWRRVRLKERRRQRDHDRVLGIDSPEARTCICHETVVGKSECPVHGPHPSLEPAKGGP
jgi:hypothetical protein